MELAVRRLFVLHTQIKPRERLLQFAVEVPFAVGQDEERLHAVFQNNRDPLLCRRVCAVGWPRKAFEVSVEAAYGRTEEQGRL